MKWETYIKVLCVEIAILILIVGTFAIYEFSSKYIINKEIDNVLPIGEYSTDDETLERVSKSKPTKDFTSPLYLRVRLKDHIDDSVEGYRYNYSLSSGDGVCFVKRGEDGSIFTTMVWPQTVLSKNEIYSVKDIDNLTEARNQAYKIFIKKLNNSYPNRKQKTYEDLEGLIRKSEGKMLGNSHCLFTNKDCSDGIVIPIDIGNYRFIFEGTSNYKRVISMYENYYKIKSNVLRISYLSLGIITFILFIITYQKYLNNRKVKILEKRNELGKDLIYTKIKSNVSNTSENYCKYCGEVIDERSIYCKYCGKPQ